jgi:hypothetical protein
MFFHHTEIRLNEATSYLVEYSTGGVVDKTFI